MQENTLTEIYLELGNNVRRIRKAQKLNQESFGEILSLSRISIANIENGRQRPTIHFIFDIILQFDIGLEDIFPVSLLELEKSKNKVNAGEKPKTADFITDMKNRLKDD